MSLRTVEEHLAAVLAHVDRIFPGPPERLRVADDTSSAALGRVLTEDARARVDIPVFDNSAMDGFAVRFADVADASPETPVRLRVIADLPAGTDLDPPLHPGETARIMTGSPVPTDADAIVPFESTEAGLADSLTETVVLAPPAARGTHIRRRGEDARTGDVILPAGTVLGALQLGALAAAGIDEIVTWPRPRVAVISTGSELASPAELAGSTLRRGMIPESNSVLLAGLVVEAGGEVVLRMSVTDDADALRAAISRAQSAFADLIVFSGGVSAGAYEVVKNTLSVPDEVIPDMEFVKVAMQPGKPQGLGRMSDGAVLFGLPGNPVSAAVSFEVFVRPAILRLQDRTDVTRPTLRLPAAVGWRTPPGRRQYLPASIDRAGGMWSVRPATAGGSGSHLAGGLGRAEAYAVVPAEVEHVEPGDRVDVLLLG